MRATTWAKLDEEFLDLPMMKAEPASRVEVENAAKRLGCTFDPDYFEFVRRYGGAMVGPAPMLGVRQAEVMGVDAWSVVEVTERFRKDGWRGVDEWYIVSIDGAGNPIGMSREGSVWVSDHDAGEIIEFADSFEVFVLAQLAQRQT